VLDIVLFLRFVELSVLCAIYCYEEFQKEFTPIVQTVLNAAGHAWPGFRGSCWAHGRTNISVIAQFGEVVRHSGLCGFHSCALYCEVSHHGLFTKIPSLSGDPGILLFRLLPKIQDHRQGSEQDRFTVKTDSFAVFESSRFVTTER